MTESAKLDRHRWAILIQRIYQADPLRCPKYGGTMKIIACIEARPDGIAPQRDRGFAIEPDVDFLGHTRREQFDQPDLP